MELIFILFLILVAVIITGHILRDSSPKITPTEALLAERKRSLSERRNQLQEKKERTEDESITLDRVHKELQALDQRIESFAQIHEVIALFANHENLNKLIRLKEVRSLGYYLLAYAMFSVTIALAVFFAVSAYYETWTWIRLVQLAQESKAALVIAVSPLAYSLLLALLFMRFHQKAEEDLTPYYSERVKWSTIYKILVAAEMVGATEPTENLVLETFLQLRGLAFRIQPPTESPAQAESVKQKEREVVVSPADIALRGVQALAGVRTLQS